MHTLLFGFPVAPNFPGQVMTLINVLSDKAMPYSTRRAGGKHEVCPYALMWQHRDIQLNTKLN